MMYSVLVSSYRFGVRIELHQGLGLRALWSGTGRQVNNVKSRHTE